MYFCSSGSKNEGHYFLSFSVFFVLYGVWGVGCGVVACREEGEPKNKQYI